MTQPRGIRFIYVDDEPSAIINCKSTIDAHNNIQSADFFQNPYQALEFIQNNPVDVAFLDIDMPLMNGFDLAEKLRETLPSLPIAFVTGDVRYLNPKLRKIQVPFIFKPYLTEEVFEVLDSIQLGA